MWRNAAYPDKCLTIDTSLAIHLALPRPCDPNNPYQRMQYFKVIGTPGTFTLDVMGACIRSDTSHNQYIYADSVCPATDSQWTMTGDLTNGVVWASTDPRLGCIWEPDPNGGIGRRLWQGYMCDGSDRSTRWIPFGD